MNVTAVVVVALASALVRERADVLLDWQARNPEPYPAVLPQMVEIDASIEVAGAVARGSEPTESTNEEAGDSPVASSDASSPAGQWEIACEIKSGSVLVFDRGSVREYGAVTLVRWSAPRTRLAAPGDQIFTAVVNCREKTIEAAWPGRSRETRTGTCGRGLVEAVCTASGEAAAGERGRRAIDRGARHSVDSVPPRR